MEAASAATRSGTTSAGLMAASRNALSSDVSGAIRANRRKRGPDSTSAAMIGTSSSGRASSTRSAANHQPEVNHRSPVVISRATPRATPSVRKIMPVRAVRRNRVPSSRTPRRLCAGVRISSRQCTVIAHAEATDTPGRHPPGQQQDDSEQRIEKEQNHPATPLSVSRVCIITPTLLRRYGKSMAFIFILYIGSAYISTQLRYGENWAQNN